MTEPISMRRAPFPDRCAGGKTATNNPTINPFEGGRAMSRARGRLYSFAAALCVAALVLVLSCVGRPSYVDTNPAIKNEQHGSGEFGNEVEKNSRRMFDEGRQIFRHDTFGSEV